MPSLIFTLTIILPKKSRWIFLHCSLTYIRTTLFKSSYILLCNGRRIYQVLHDRGERQKKGCEHCIAEASSECVFTSQFTSFCHPVSEYVCKLSTRVISWRQGAQFEWICAKLKETDCSQVIMKRDIFDELKESVTKAGGCVAPALRTRCFLDTQGLIAN